MNPVKNIATTTSIQVSQPQNVSADATKKAAAVLPAIESSTPALKAQQLAISASAAEQAESTAQAIARQQEALDAALERVNAQASSFSPALKFEPDADSGVVIIKVMNRSTGEVIRQLPPEAVIKASADGSVPALVAETV